MRPRFPLPRGAEKIYPKDSFDNQYVQLLSFSKIEYFFLKSLQKKPTIIPTKTRL